MFKFLTKKHAAIKKSRTCKGWTSYKMLEQLYDLVQSVDSVDGDILEIGSAWGRSAILLLTASKKKFYSIDPHTGGRAFIEQNKKQNSLEYFKENIAKFSFEERTTLLVKTTQEVTEEKTLNNHKFAFVFIDGLHSAEGVKIDFDLSYSLLSKNGIMAFDDYFSESIPDYTAMIDQLCQENNIKLIKDTEAKLVYFIK